MKQLRQFTCLSLLALFAACQNGPAPAPVVYALPVPSKSGGQPNLHTTPNGTAYLSWVEYADDTTDVLVFSKMTNGNWDKPLEVARGSNWFVNWADFPSLTAFADEETLAAHWLQKTSPETFDYDVRIAQSKDRGKTWGPSFVLHADGFAAEHGFVSLLPLKTDRVLGTWLDGRATKTGNIAKENEHSHGGEMALWAVEFDKSGQLFKEVELDGRVCDCCQTAAAMTSDGPIIAYRNRSDEEVRDIYFVKLKDGQWSKPKAIFADNWHITGCPVNGPSLAVLGHTVALAWYTGADDKPMVKIAFSKDDGQAFGPPVPMDDGLPLGRVDVVLLSEEKALVSWLEKKGDAAEIRAAMVTADGQKAPSFLVVKTSQSRQSGFPRMEKLGDKIIFAWVETGTKDKDVTSVKSGYFNY